MRATYSSLMNSRYFNPAFNSAIFDGPFRIYFSQFQESQALKIYFSLQEKLPAATQKAKDLHRTKGTNLLVMLYPTQDAFQMSFEGCKDFLVEESLGDDTLIGINGPFDDESLKLVLAAMDQAIEKWPVEHPLTAEDEIHHVTINEGPTA